MINRLTDKSAADNLYVEFNELKVSSAKSSCFDESHYYDIVESYEELIAEYNKNGFLNPEAAEHHMAHKVDEDGLVRLEPSNVNRKERFTK